MTATQHHHVRDTAESTTPRGPDHVNEFKFTFLVMSRRVAWSFAVMAPKNVFHNNKCLSVDPVKISRVVLPLPRLSMDFSG
jgi:hypothetical protein